MGLLHQDAFGPIGQGFAVEPLMNGLDFNPPYTGPRNATESQFHLMATPAFGFPGIDAGDAFFGVRSAIKLATFSSAGQVLNEQIASHSTVNSAQPITLPELYVPNTTQTGPLVGMDLNVNATTVLGSIASVAETDVYSITASAGDILNLEIFSVLLARTTPARITDPFDSFVRVVDSTGTPLSLGSGQAVNDNAILVRPGINDSDAGILDLPITADGTYYIEISSTPPSPSGSYELFVSLFDATTPFVPPANPQQPASPFGDVIRGGRETIPSLAMQETIC